MRITVVTLVWMLIAAAASVVAGGATEERVLGGGLTIEETTPIPMLIAAPQDHAGTAVRIEGVITEVCTRHGDWIKVSTPSSGSGILVRVEDAAFLFPPDCVTRSISLEGVLETEGKEATANDSRVCAAMTREGVRFYLSAMGAVIHGLESDPATGGLTEAEKRFQGDWKLSSHGSGFATGTLRIDDREFRADTVHGSYVGRVSIRADTAPAQLDFTIEDCGCKFDGMTSAAIWREEDDGTIVFAAPAPGEPRPQAFAGLDETKFMIQRATRPVEGDGETRP
jgi:hypothetical protein